MKQHKIDVNQAHTTKWEGFLSEITIFSAQLKYFIIFQRNQEFGLI